MDREPRRGAPRRELSETRENVYGEEGAELPEWTEDALDEDSEMIARILDGMLAYD
jgi:hypothetical protein